SLRSIIRQALWPESPYDFSLLLPRTPAPPHPHTPHPAPHKKAACPLGQAAGFHSSLAVNC
ncbi:hypothetical protein, partial [Planktothricoides sp. SR001]|uniref:hypothetical protein n=1 Tax=Planktothricoides sp. SR001 TaxID=1705388 RepID=UPI001E49E7CB